MSSKMHKEFCGIFGAWAASNAAEAVYLGLYALQHRGQESAGIVSSQRKRFYERKGMGLVSDIFSTAELQKLKGETAIGHVRYSTTGSTSYGNVQPLIVDYQNKPIAIAHNGNIPQAKRWRRKLEEEGVIFSTETDSEVILKMLVKEKGEWEERLKKVMNRLKGAFSLLLLFPDKLIAARDSFGFRPLCIGEKESSVFFSSESCTFELVGASYLRNLKPGEIVVLEKSRSFSLQLESQPHNRCIFELIYFSRPDSVIFSQSVYQARLNMGGELAKENRIEADIVMSVPDSANIQALGYSKGSGIPLEFGFIRNHYVGRTFIEPLQKIRDFRVKIKYSPIKEVLKGQRVILIDDSIVRGTTSRKLIGLIKKAGAKEIHLCISSPPIRFPCFYGIDTPTKKELIANQLNLEEIKDFLGVDSLQYLSIDGLLRACEKMGYCLACFNGKYPL